MTARIKMGIANPCYKCGNLTKHKIVWINEMQQALCDKCDPEEQEKLKVRREKNIIGTCLKCKKEVPESEAGWDCAGGGEILTHFTKEGCNGKVKQYKVTE